MPNLFDDGTPPRTFVAPHVLTESVPPVRPAQAIVPKEVALPPTPSRILDPASFQQAGFALIEKSTGVSKRVLAEESTTKGGEFAEKLTQMTLQAKGFDATVFGHGLVGFVRNLGHVSRERVETAYMNFDRRVERLKAEMSVLVTDLKKSDGIFEDLFQENFVLYHELDELLGRARADLAAEREAISVLPAPKNGMEAQLQAERVNASDQFEEYLLDLDKALTLSLQTGAEIKSAQENGRLLIRQFNVITGITIEAYRKQFALFLLQDGQKKSSDLATTVKDTTNQAMITNAKLQRSTTVAVAKSAQRGALDMETLRTLNQELIQGLEEKRTIYQEARERRKLETAEVKRLRDDLVAQAIAVRNGPA